MFSWLSNMPVWFQIVFTLALITIGSLVIFMLIRKGFTLKTSKGTMTVGKGEDSKESPCSSCPNAKSIAILLNETQKIISRKDEIQFIDILKSQMNYAEERISQIAIILQKMYTDILSRKKTGTSGDSNFKMYKLILRTTQEILIDYLRATFRKDGLGEMTEQEYGSYLETKLITFHEKITSTISDLYFTNECITIDELNEMNKVNSSEIESIIRDIFWNARKVALESYSELQELDTELENLLKETLYN